VRRPFEPDELIRVIATALAHPEVSHGLTGMERALLYRLASETGLRWSELRSLRRASFALAGDLPTVTVDAKDEKAGRGDTLPLRPELAADLAAHFAAHPGEASDRAFPMNLDDGAEMLAADLARTGDSPEVAAAKLARGETPLAPISPYDAAGRVADFHALRHTFGTNLARAGVHPKVAQDLMRHSTIELTMNVYSHTKLESRAAALAGLPNVAPAKPDAPPSSQSA
jgi:integrase